MKKSFIFLFILGCTFLCTTVLAQRVSLTANIRALGIQKITGTSGTAANYGGSTSFSGNLRLFTKNHFAFRAGLGLNNLHYTFTDGLQTNYDAVRESMTAYLGLEKHFVAGFLTPYVGVYVPLTFNSKNSIKDISGNLWQDLTDGEKFKAGFSVLGGLNIKLLKVLRLGVEANIGFESFKSELFEPLLSDPSSIEFKNLDVALEATIGVAF